MKKILSLVLCVTLFSVLLPFGGVIASEETVTPEYISVPVNIADSLRNVRLFADYGDVLNFVHYKNSLSFDGTAETSVMSIQGFKGAITTQHGKINYSWKNQWQKGTDGKYLDSDNKNTLILSGIEYDMTVNSADQGSSAIELNGNQKPEFSVESGYYSKVNFLAQSVLGVGYNSTTTNDGLDVTLTYEDGSKEEKNTGAIYSSVSNAVENLGEPYIMADIIKGTADSTAKTTTFAATSPEWTYSYIKPYSVDVDSDKKLKSITVNGKVNTTLFSITALTTKDLQDKTYIDAVESALTDLGEVSELTYSSENATKINTLNQALQACTTNNVTLSDTLQSNANAVLSAWAELLPVSVPVDISKTALGAVKIFANYNESVSGWWESSLSYLNSQKRIMSLKSFKDGDGNFTWKTSWQKDGNGNYLDSEITNTAVLDGIEYNMTVQSATKGGSAYEFNNHNEANYTLTEGYYSDISLLLDGPLGKEYYSSNQNAITKLTIQLNYADGSNEKVTTADIHNSYYSGSGSYMKVATLNATTANNVTTFAGENSGADVYIISYSVPVDKNKKLTSFTILTEGGHANIFAITALTNKGLQQKSEDEKVVSVPVKIADSLYTRKVYSNFGETAKVAWNMFSYGRTANIYLDGFKNKQQNTSGYGLVNYDWKNAWGKNDKRNTLIMDSTGIEYDMYLESSQNGGGAVDASGNAGVLSFDVSDNYYEKISLLLSGITGIGYNNATTDKGLQIVLTYADGTEELKTTDGLYNGWSNGVERDEKLKNGFLRLNVIQEISSESAPQGDTTYEKTTTFGTELTSYPAFITAYEVEVNKEKLLEKISVISGNTKAGLNNNGKCVYTYESGANSGANLFAITAVSTKGTMEKNKTTELTALVNGITADSLTYTRENAGKVSCINKLYKALTADGITLDSGLTAKISDINSKWQTLSAQKPILIGEISNSTYTNGDYTYLQVNATLINSAVESGISGDVFVALYDKTTNKLLEVKTITSQSFAYGTEVTLNESFGINANDLEKYEVKAFVWDSLSEMKPISEFAAIK